MKILALDSTAVVGSVALCEDSRMVAHYTLNTGNTHSQTLLPMIESVLKSAEWEIDDLDRHTLFLQNTFYTDDRQHREATY